MTLTECIAICDELRPGNKWSNDLKTRWINEVMGMIHTQVHMAKMQAWQYEAYEYPAQQGDVDPELDIPLPYDRMFWLYLVAMVDFANGDYESYNNTYKLFNEVLLDYKKWFIVRYEPGKATKERKEAEGYEPHPRIRGL